MIIKPVLNISDKDIEDIVRIYHFKPCDKAWIAGVFHSIENIIKPVIYYDILDNITGYNYFEADEIHSDIYEEIDVKSGILLVACTLGSHIDNLTNVYMEAEDICTANVLDSICCYIMRKMYDILAHKIEKENKAIIQKYYFAGEHIDIKFIPRILEKLNVNNISCNNHYSLLPLKSVVYICQLTNDKNKCANNICNNCTNVNCCVRQKET